MRGYRLLVIVCWVALLTACNQEPEMGVTLHECAAMPSARACATAFTVNDKAYVFGGRDSAGVLCNDLWQYDAVTDQWTALGATPLYARVNATACVHANKVYIGLGFNGKYSKDSSYLQDWWEYEPTAGTWTQLADYPNHYTDDATAFAGNGELYVGYGFCWNYRRDLFRYDIATDAWDSIDVKVAFHGYPIRSFGGTGCTCQNRHFMGTGFYKSSLNWWAEFVDGTHWEQRAAVPGRTRTLAASTATKTAIYLSGGIHYGGVNTTGEVLRDIRRYDPQTDRWQLVTMLPQGLINHTSFALGKRVYIGLGETEEWQATNKIYYFEE